MKISVLGLGHMGAAIATHLIDQGHTVTVWNRTASRAMSFAGRAVIAANAADALAGANLAVVSTLDNSAARSILVSAGEQARGSLVVNLSSDTPETARVLSAWALDHGVRYISGVMLTPSTIVGQRGSTMLIAGDEADLDTAMPVLSTIAPNVTPLGNDHELPSSFDTALLGVFWTTLAAWSHGTALAKAHGIDGESIAARLAAMVHLAAEIGPSFARDADNKPYPAETSTIASAVTTMQHVTTASNDAGVDVSLPTAVTALYERAARGHETEAPSRVTEAM
ncbi:NAD(P)-binding domain-containing protein [Rhodococcus sp. H29-C3]|uniref:NAD(P)-dependent oxidoreductase n=1 Tax=Rhodococcus sp. H29-C3 TaxID=3046307 RepID=UPI0024BA0C70|nr:NAD(P)-binding domain-containing protein [Rhodococcus sp. H29-C3]MDJ0363370.1 NAD(P)-binding domain-containing protein [Rhodococcus sp. H29-C3]